MNHYHCDIIAYKAKDGDKLLDSTTVSIIGFLDETSTIKKAQELLPGRLYHLARLWECNTCTFNKKQKNNG